MTVRKLCQPVGSLDAEKIAEAIFLYVITIAFPASLKEKIVSIAHFHFYNTSGFWGGGRANQTHKYNDITTFRHNLPRGRLSEK